MLNILRHAFSGCWNEWNSEQQTSQSWENFSSMLGKNGEPLGFEYKSSSKQASHRETTSWWWLPVPIIFKLKLLHSSQLSKLLSSPFPWLFDKGTIVRLGWDVVKEDLVKILYWLVLISAWKLGWGGFFKKFRHKLLLLDLFLRVCWSVQVWGFEIGNAYVNLAGCNIFWLCLTRMPHLNLFVFWIRSKVENFIIGVFSLLLFISLVSSFWREHMRGKNVNFLKYCSLSHFSRSAGGVRLVVLKAAAVNFKECKLKMDRAEKITIA